MEEHCAISAFFIFLRNKMEQETANRRQLPVGLHNLIKNALREAFADHPNVNIAIEKFKIRPSNIADYEIDCRQIAFYIGMQDHVNEVANKIRDRISIAGSIIKKVQTENGFLNLFKDDSGAQRCCCKSGRAIS